MNIALIIWSNPEMYINLLFTAKKLLEKKNKVFLFCRGYPKNLRSFKYFNYFNKIQIISVPETENKYLDKINLLKLIFKSIYYIFNYKINLIIGYNFHGLLVAKINKIFRKKLKIIYHNFDFNEKDESNSQIIQTFLTKKFLNNVIGVITPSKNRSRIFKKKYLLKTMPISMLNSFPLDFKIKKKKFFNNRRLIIRLGTFNQFHSIENLIYSSKYLNNKYQIIIAGKSYNNFYKKMKNIVIKNKLKNVTLLKNITYKYWFRLLSGADLGVALYESINTSHENMAGTSQKLNNYILANIPSIVNSTNEFVKFNRMYDISYLIKNDQPTQLAKKIKTIFRNKKLYNKKIKNNRILFKKKLNFDYQFLKIVKLLNIN